MSTTTTTTTTAIEIIPIPTAGDAPVIPLQDANHEPHLRKTAEVSNLKKVVVTVQLSGINFATSCSNGLVTIGLPAMSASLGLPESLSFWPASATALATASTLLLMGSIADALGPKWIDLLGCALCGGVMLGAGLVQTGEQLVVMRALSGVGLAMHLCSSVSIVTGILPRGRGRNIAFGCLGLSQPLGFSFGLVVGGFLVDGVGWRAGWYIYGALTILLVLIGVWAIPASALTGTLKERLKNMVKTVDWLGAILASTFMATLCYLLAILSIESSRIRDADAISCLVLGVVALASFVHWMHFRVKVHKPALIPNSLWKNSAFTTICATVVLSYATVNSLELFASLFFQQVQHLSALQSSLRILPSLIVGALLNLGTGFVVHKFPVMWLVVVSSVLCAGSPSLMAVIQPEWTYWANAFVAQLLQPVSVDILFTVGLIVITDSFPEDTQALAGAVFNTAGQFGMAFGLSVLQVISQQVEKGQGHSGLSGVQALLEGYRASFWAMFGFMLLCAVLGAAGLRKTGKVGMKRD